MSHLAQEPGCTADNFLSPLAFSPRDISLAEIERRVRDYQERLCNLVLANQAHSYPPWGIKLNYALAKLILPGQPPWRMYILGRRLLGWWSRHLLRRPWLSPRLGTKPGG